MKLRTFFPCCLFIFLFLNQAQAQEKLQGKYHTPFHCFVPSDSLYSMVPMPNDSFGILMHDGKAGVLSKSGLVLIEPVYDEIILTNGLFAVFAINRNGQQYTNNFEHWLIPINRQEKKYTLIRDYSLSSEDANDKQCIVSENNLYAIYDLANGKLKSSFMPQIIKRVFPSGYLISGEPEKALNGTNKRMYSGDTIWYAYYDSNMKRKTDFHFQQLEVRGKGDAGFLAISKYGKGLLDAEGNTILPPVLDRFDVTSDKKFIVAYFDGLGDIEGHDGYGFMATTNNKVQIYRSNGSLLVKDTFLKYDGFIRDDQVFVVVRKGDYSIFVPKPDDEIVPAGLVGYVDHPKMNLMDTTGTFLLDHDYDDIDYVRDHVYLLTANKKKFLYDIRKRSIIPIQGEQINTWSLPFIKTYTKNNTIGLIGLDGKVWQDKFFNDIECDGNVALLYEGKKRILIDDHFKMIFNPMVYDSIVISRFADTSLFIVGKKSGTDYRWGVIRKNGKEVVPPLYEEIRIDEHPLYKFLVKKNGKAGILDPNGKILLPCMYDYTEGYNDNYHKVGVGFQGHYISLEKDLQVPRIQGYIRERPYACGVYVCFNEKGKLNLLNALNEPVLKEAADYIEPVGELDLFIVKQQNRFGLINGRGKFIIPLEWDTLEYHYGLQLFLGNKNGGMQIFTKEGQPIHHPPFEEIESALGNGELMKFRYHQKEGLMKNSGETVLEARYELVYAQSTNVFLVKEDGQYYYMDSDKNVLTEKSSAHYSKYGSFYLSMAKPCMHLYDSTFHKIENGCGKSLTSTSCNHYYLLSTDSGRICISASGKPLHTGYFDDVVEYGCENSVRIASKQQKYFLLNDHFQKISKEYASIGPYNTMKRCRVRNQDFLYGWMDFEGKELLPALYKSIDIIEESKKLKAMTADGSTFWFDWDGKEIKP